MAANEVISHCELLMAGGDVTEVDHKKYAANGKQGFGAYIESLEPDPPGTEN